MPLRRTLFALCAAVALAGRANPLPAAAGSLRGRVDIGRPERAPDPRPGVSGLGDNLAYRPAPPRRAVVYLESAPQGAFEEGGAPRATMRQEHETFIPHVLAIRAGTVVDFPNGDPIFHNVFSLSKVKRFDLGRYAKGRSKSVQFDDPGIVRVFCDIHSHMSAFILVFAHRFFTITDEDGRYRIDRVPPGNYTVTAWYEAVAQQSRSVTIPDQGGPVDLDFSLRER